MVLINSPLYRILHCWHKIIFWVCQAEAQHHSVAWLNHVYQDVHVWTLKSTDVLWNDLLRHLDKHVRWVSVGIIKGTVRQIRMSRKWYHWINNDNRTSTAVCSTIFLFFLFSIDSKVLSRFYIKKNSSKPGLHWILSSCWLGQFDNK